MRRILERGLTAAITLVALALFLASGVGIASLARSEPLIAKDNWPGAARATTGRAHAVTPPERSAGPGR